MNWSLTPLAFGSGVANAGLLASIAVERKTFDHATDPYGTGATYAAVSETDYSYYASGDSYGNPGDLKLALTKDSDGVVTDTKYYRYYTSGETGGAVGQIKFIVGSESYARLAASLSGSDTPQDATDTQVIPYADAHYTYDSQGRLATRVLQGAGCWACAGGLGTFTFTYAANSADLLGPNYWLNKTVETMPDGTVETYYFNGYNEQMLKVTTDPISGISTGEFTAYDSQGRVVLSAAPAAVLLPASLSTLEEYPELLHLVDGNYQYLADSAGQVTTTTYYDSTSSDIATPSSSVYHGVAGYTEETSIQLGENGTPIPQEKFGYLSLSSGAGTIYEVYQDTLFGGSASSDTRTTLYSYSLYSGTTQVASETMTLPSTSSQNGPSGAATQSVYYDIYGRPTFTLDANGRVGYTAYDDATGAVTESVTDVNSDEESADGITSTPSGLTIPSDGLNLATRYQGNSKGTRIFDIVSKVCVPVDFRKGLRPR